MELFDVVVVGGGIEGSSCAYWSARRGWRTLLLDWFPLCHDQGSSSGATRGIRSLYDKHRVYTPMALESLRLWQQLQAESGRKIYTKTGLLSLVKKGLGDIKGAQDALEKYGVERKILDTSSLKRQFPELSNFTDDYDITYEVDAGVLSVKNALRTFHEQFVKFEGQVRDKEEVLRLEQNKGHVTVSTNQGAYRCHHVIIAAGAWTNKILANLNLELPLKVERLSVLYWKKKRDKVKGEVESLPNIWHESEDYKSNFYSTAGDEHPGYIKLCYHGGVEMDPDSTEEVNDAEEVQEVARFIGDHLPGVDATLGPIRERCVYTTTPDGDYILDRHPLYPRILIATGFSGHGFKMAPLIGQLMCDVIAGVEPKFDLAPFRISRFRSEESLSKL